MAKKEDTDELLKAAPVESIELSEKEKLEIEAEAKAEVAKELKAEKRKEFKAAAKQRLKKQVLFSAAKDDTGADLVYVLLQLAGHMPNIQLDGKRYYSGRGYWVNAGTAQVLFDQMFRGDLHDAEIHGKNMTEFFGQRPRNLAVGPRTPLPPDLIN